MKTIEPHNPGKEFIEAIKKHYVLNIKGFNPDQMVVATILFEGRKDECK